MKMVHVTRPLEYVSQAFKGFLITILIIVGVIGWVLW